MATYEEAYSKSLEYYNGDDLCAKTFVDKYALRDHSNDYLEKIPDDMHKRLAKELYRIEKGYPNSRSYEEIEEALLSFRYFVPQGSPMFGIGNPHALISLSNCFVVSSPLDSVSSIVEQGKDLANIMKRRGGVGIDISNLRPDGAAVNNAARTSTGAWSFADLYSYICRMIGQAGRRGALMITIDVRHPDIFKFATMKRDLKMVTGANVSIKINDAFMRAVRDDRNFTLQFPIESKTPEIKKVIRARDLWDIIIESVHQGAEPGLLMWDNILKELPAQCYADVGFDTISTNPSLRGDTRVLTNIGALPIKYLAENHTTGLKVRNVFGEWHDCRIFKSGENKQLYKVNFSNGNSVYCTPEHKWPVLSTLNKLVNEHTGQIKKKRTDELSVGDKFYSPSFPMPIDNLGCRFTHEDGFVLGWLTGDGWMSYHSNNDAQQYGFIFGEKDVQSGISDRVLSYTNSLAKRPSSIRRDHQTNSFSYCTTDAGVHERFKSIGARHKSEGIPDSVWRGNAEFVSGYVDGLFSSDGHVRCTEKLSTSYIVFTTSHQKLAEDVVVLLGFYGVSCNLRQSTSKLNGKEFTRFDIKISGIQAHKFASMFFLSNTDKQSKLKSIASFEVGVPTYSGRKEYANGREYVVVSSVEETNLYEDVYDITVFDDTHTFAISSMITGNCGEIPLSSEDACRLLALNLSGFVSNAFQKDAYFDFDLFREKVRLAQRMMDNIVDLELECTQKIIDRVSDPAEKCLWQKIYKRGADGRRTGLGTFALADALAQLRLRYDSDEALETVERIYKTLRDGAYEESTQLAKERGPFLVWSHEKEKDNPFIKRLPKNIRDEMSVSGRRNISILTNAPTGSVSICSFNSSSGIEPVFRNFYTRRKKVNPNDEGAKVDFIDELGDKWQEFNVFHRNVSDWIRMNVENWDGNDVPDLPKYFVTSDQINWEKRVKLQGVIQRYIDHSISSTINLPSDVTLETVGKLYLKAWEEGLKGVTIYRDGSRTGVLVTSTKDKDGRPKQISRTHAPKRPQVVPCDIYHGKVQGEDWTIIVGLLHGEPYELFGGPSEDTAIPRTVKNGFMEKVPVGKDKNRYDLVYSHHNEEASIKDIGNMFENKAYGTFTRILSLSLRHGAPIEHLIAQLSKDQSETLNSLSSILKRALKKYIKDGTIVSGEKEGCGKCGSHNLKYSDGCPTCLDCGYTKCG